MSDDKKLIIYGVHVPLPCDRYEEGLEGFITPWWYDIMEFFGTWRQEVEARGDEPWPIQPYMLQVLKQIAKKGGQRTSQELMTRLMQHFGLPWLEKYKARYDKETASDG